MVNRAILVCAFFSVKKNRFAMRVFLKTLRPKPEKYTGLFKEFVTFYSKAFTIKLQTLVKKNRRFISEKASRNVLLTMHVLPKTIGTTPFYVQRRSVRGHQPIANQPAARPC